MNVAQTILNQLGRRGFLVMTGAKNLTGSVNSLSMRLNGKCEHGAVNVLCVTLDPSDTYTVESFYLRAGSMKSRVKKIDVYCDMLQDAFTEATGLYTHL